MIRGVILGMGKIAQTGHMPAYEDPSVAGLISIAAAVEPNARSRAAAAERFPDLKFYDTLDDCLATEQPDFVDICTPPVTHGGFIEALLPRPHHILCEKPFSIEEHAARTLADRLSRTTSRVFMGCHQYRFSPVWKQFQDFRRSMSDDDSFTLQFDIYRKEADPGLNGEEGVWRTDRRISGGGILADMGIHYLYLCYWLFGTPLALTARTTALLYTESFVEDTASVILEYPNGIARINCTWAADRRVNCARLVTRGKSLHYDGSSLLRYTAESRDELIVPDAADKRTYIGMYAELFREFAQQIDKHTMQQEWIDEAYESVRLLHACYASATEEITVRIGK
jgi:predicted dehydrogenase